MYAFTTRAGSLHTRAPRTQTSVESSIQPSFVSGVQELCLRMLGSGFHAGLVRWSSTGVFEVSGLCTSRYCSTRSLALVHYIASFKITCVQ